MVFRRADTFDLLMAAALVGMLLGLLVLLLGAGGRGGGGSLSSAAYQSALQQKLQREARLEQLESMYRPVQEALTEQRPAEALLALDEIARHYPGEPHGLMLRGEIQLAMGATYEGVQNIASAVRQDGEYLEEGGVLSRRSLLERLVDEELPRLQAANRTPAPSPAAQRTLQELRYLQSRLAGGCE